MKIRYYNDMVNKTFDFDIMYLSSKDDEIMKAILVFCRGLFNDIDDTNVHACVNRIKDSIQEGRRQHLLNFNSSTIPAPLPPSPSESSLDAAPYLVQIFANNRSIDLYLKNLDDASILESATNACVQIVVEQNKSPPLSDLDTPEGQQEFNEKCVAPLVDNLNKVAAGYLATKSPVVIDSTSQIASRVYHVNIPVFYGDDSEEKEKGPTKVTVRYFSTCSLVFTSFLFDFI